MLYPFLQKSHSLSTVSHSHSLSHSLSFFFLPVLHSLSFHCNPRQCFGVVVLQMLDGNEGIHHSPIVLAEKSKGCCLVCLLVSLTEENPKAQGFFLGLTVLWLIGPKNDLWVLLSPILLCFLFSFGCFGRKTQRLMLGSFLSHEENPKAEAFFLGLAVLCLG